MAQNQTIDVTVRLDRNLKASGEAFFHSMGVNFSTAVNILVRQAIQGKIPFKIDEESEPPDFQYSAALETDDPFFNRATQAEIARRIRDDDADGYLINFEELKKKAARLV